MDALADGAIVVDAESGDFIASGVSVLNLKSGSKNGGKKTQAASAAALDAGAVSIKVSEDCCGTDLRSEGKFLQVFNGNRPGAVGGKEGLKIPLRAPGADIMSADEFMRLAGEGQKTGVIAWLKLGRRADGPRDEFVSDLSLFSRVP